MSAKSKFIMGDAMKELKKLSKKSVIVGFAGVKGAKKAEGDNITIGEYANIMDKGSIKRNIPARPFFRRALFFPEGKQMLNNMKSKLLQKLIEGKIDAIGFYQAIGLFAKGQIIKSINKGGFAPLKQATIKAKDGKTKQLIDTGSMINAVEFEVKER